ncbi:PucR family transcriptional regulator [Caldicellulosiruptor changbaiensis]|uniref:PucR family transcriptional regulator n=1 Tax=Caldicellulosiruptor changbaiensis TaxID=1222016 RepID=A0A3T0D2L2_9FIRM|nr:PucR family transcriptional regulator [Caldicellulosiruptor changbaiensis]AZT89502.1 PucR family transcriptional regulator [Caldicellulosiruptor changbaiensis]
MIKCKEILSLPALKDLRLVAGENGLDRNLTWIHISDVPEVAEYVQGGELLFTTGLYIRNDAEKWIKLIQKINEKNLAGLVINVGPYIDDIPFEVAKCAESLDFPLFKLPWDVKLVEVTKEICDYIIKRRIEERNKNELLENILFGDFDANENEILFSKAEYYGYKLDQRHCIVIVDIDNFGEFLKKHDIKEEQTITEIKYKLQQIVTNTFEEFNKKFLWIFKKDSIILMVRCLENQSEFSLRPILNTIKERISQRLKPLTVSIGVGKCYSEISQMQKSFKEAEKALKFAHCIKRGNSIAYYSEMGVFCLLYEFERHKEKLEEFCKQMLGPLKKYDEENQTELLKTLEVFLDENCNMVHSAKKMFIHRSTLMYRLKKIEEILGIEISNSENRFNLKLALEVNKFLDSYRMKENEYE